MGCCFVPLLQTLSADGNVGRSPHDAAARAADVRRAARILSERSPEVRPLILAGRFSHAEMSMTCSL